MPQSEFRFEQPASDTPVMRGPGIEVSFTFSQGNGWDHQLRFDDGPTASIKGPGRWLVRPATAIEDEIEPAEPGRIANPVYQAFVPHELAGDRGLCALLTGSCFNHHFSAVLSLYPDPEMPLRVVFEVDLADRCRGSVDELAATYLVSDAAGTATPKGASSNRIAWQDGSPGHGLLELIAMPPAIIDDPTFFSTATRVRIQARIDPSTHTQRMHYRWRWASCADLTR